MLNTNAEVLHLNPRKQGSEDAETLALDIKLKAEGVPDALVSRLVGCADARAYLWDVDGNPTLLGITEMVSEANYEDCRGAIAGFLLLGVKVKKFRVTPRARWSGDLVFQVSITDPEPTLLPVLHEHMGRSVRVELERSQQDLFEQPATAVYREEPAPWTLADTVAVLIEDLGLEVEPLAWDDYVELYPGETWLPLPAPLWCWWWLAWTRVDLVESWVVEAQWVYARLLDIEGARDGMPEPWGAASAWADIKPLAIPGAVEPSPPADPSPATEIDPKSAAYRAGFSQLGRGVMASEPEYRAGGALGEIWQRGWDHARAISEQCRVATTDSEVLGAVIGLVAHEDEVLAADWTRLYDGRPTHLGESIRQCLERGRDLLTPEPPARPNRRLVESIERMLAAGEPPPPPGADPELVAEMREAGLVMTADESAAALAEMREQTARLQAATMPRPIDVDAEWVLARPARDMIDRYAPWRDATPEVLARALEIEMAKGSRCRTSVVEKIKKRLAAQQEAS